MNKKNYQISNSFIESENFLVWILPYKGRSKKNPIVHILLVSYVFYFNNFYSTTTWESITLRKVHIGDGNFKFNGEDKVKIASHVPFPNMVERRKKK